MNILHQANQIIVDGTYTIPTNVTETFEAKNIIRWKPGFKASTGSVVRAHVDPNAVFAASKMDELTYTYNSGTNKLQRVTDAVSSTAYAGDLDSQPVNNYAYDANGNMIQDLEKGIGYVLYDINNLPIRVYKTNGNVTDYIYDCQGERAKKITPTLSTWYINGVGSKTSFIKTSDINDSYTVNLYGNDAIGQARVVGGAPIRYYYLKDHLGSIRATINGTDGSLASYDDYYPFGMVMDNRSASMGNPDTRYKFTGKERDIETGYDYFGARYYDSRIGRWLTMDPLAEKYPGWSAYNYVLNNPLKLVDTNGKWPTWVHNALIQKAFAGDKDYSIKGLQAASLFADSRQFQKAQESYRHAMRAYGTTMEEGIKSINKFLNETADTDNERDFGIKLHAIMDMTSPAHADVKEWGAPHTIKVRIGDLDLNSESTSHFLMEVNASPVEQNAAAKVMRMFKDDYQAKKIKDFRGYQNAYKKYLDEEKDKKEKYELEKRMYSR